MKLNGKLFSQSTVAQNLNGIVEVADQSDLEKDEGIYSIAVFKSLQAADGNFGEFYAEVILKAAVLRQSAVPGSLTAFKAGGLQTAGAGALTVGAASGGLYAAAVAAADALAGVMGTGIGFNGI